MTSPTINSELQVRVLTECDLVEIATRREILSIIENEDWSGESLAEDIANLRALITEGTIETDKRYPEYLMNYIKSLKGVKE